MKTIPMKQQSTMMEPAPGAGAMEGARRATGVAPAPGGADTSIFSPPDPEVPEDKRRRKFTAKYKLKILAETDACTELGQIGAVLRREGLYSSYLTTWRKQREDGVLQSMSPKKRGRKRKEINPLAKQIARLEAENRRLQQRLKKAEAIIEVQKKISEILGIDQKPENSERSTS